MFVLLAKLQQFIVTECSNMAMGAGGFSSRVVATAVVATDGTGDFTDIPAAIASLPAGGGVVYVKEGTYTIGSAIVITKSIPFKISADPPSPSI